MGPTGVGDAGRVGRAEEEGKEAETASACPQILPRTLGFLSCLLLSPWSLCFMYQHMPNTVTGCLTLWFWGLADLWSPERTPCVAVRGREGLLGRGSSGPGDSGVERAWWVGPSACSRCLTRLPHFHTSPLLGSQL